MAAPSGEIELFLATQLVDEARHTAMFDRFGAEVMALSGDDLRSRLRELEQTMLSPWHDVFDGTLREIAERIKAQPDDLDLFVDGIVTYHMVIEGVLAMTGQHLIGKLHRGARPLSRASARASRWSSATSTATSPSASAS